MAFIRYMVSDVVQAVDFYCGKLDFKLEDQWGPAFAIVSRDNFKLWLSGPETSAARPMPDGRHPQPGGWNRIVIIAENLDSMIEKLKNGDIKFRSEIVTGPGGRHILIDDPSGNPLEIFERIKKE